MISKSGRGFTRLAVDAVGVTVATSMLPSDIQAALAIPAYRQYGNLKNVEHVVILMQESRSSNHCFGALKGIHGFGDHMAISLSNDQRAWHREDSKNETPPYHFGTNTINAQRADSTPHT